MRLKYMCFRFEEFKHSFGEKLMGWALKIDAIWEMENRLVWLREECGLVLFKVWLPRFLWTTHLFLDVSDEVN